MRKEISLISIAILLGIHLGIFQFKLYAQIPWINKSRQSHKQTSYNQLFQYKTLSLPTFYHDTVQVYFYAKIANDLIQFVLKDSIYTAKYELTVDIKNTSNESVIGKIKRGKILTKDFASTNARNQFKRERFDFYLSPGEYNLFIELLDLETKFPIRKKEKIELPNFISKTFKTTQLLFYHQIKDDSSNISNIFPDLPAIRTPSDSSFKALFYICSGSYPRHIHINQALFTHNNKLFFEDSLDITLNSQIQSVILDLGKELDFGEYTLKLEITDGESKIELEDFFHVKWKSHPTSLKDLDQAIETLTYLMTPHQFNQLKKLSEKEQKQAFEKFWKERDPDPGTEENELEEEYYKRIAFANQNFSNWLEKNIGWQTDRGRIYIIYGAPSDVDRPLTSTGEPGNYEIWYYRNTQKRFVFFDKFGSGNYRLISEE